MDHAREALRRARAWLFDFDGTLTDYHVADAQALSSLREKHFAAVPAEEFTVRAHRARTAYYGLARAAGPGAGPEAGARAGLDDFRVGSLLEQEGRAGDPAVVSHYQAALRQATVAAPGAEALLGALASRLPVAVVSNAYDVEPQRSRVVATGLQSLLSDVLIAAEVGHFKPDPTLLLIAAERLGVPPSACVYVGDSVDFDVVAATAAGMTSVLVAEQGSPEADVHVTSLRALHDLVRGLGITD
ncbi:phosphoglycolate phosphatase/putative hydrolase of the HAD superfamily [Humibacillus xanthopallidus]|uniref:Phosphoglycolate phosphatase/putative hydrolase of the HAD superfamily n=1 Tax=Humibacillus xanthopallidus TaxID=412689 RepID=A0A543PKF3_9MICO|nr:HAD family hydrolase [Humibacillus xanthopallidus]TQN44561.1 phosphoglycolate phosphatase/putative hydrolase of the HAD superfamily [Humibacillus xanthopallidus]